MNFVVIEGLDGSGKSTQLKMLKTYCDEKNIAYKYLHFPRTESEIYGDLISKFLRGELGDINTVNPYLIALIYAGDRENAKKTIRAWINNNYLVIVDRYVYSNIAFQCAKLNNQEEISKLSEWIKQLEYEYFKIPKPDLNIFLNVPLDFTKKILETHREGDDREYLNGKDDIHEKDLDFQRKVQDIYLTEAKNEKKLQIINCFEKEGDILKPKEIFREIIKTLKNNKIF
ncbi:MAG: dTMP kinase [Bacteroidales bacterium]|jgi:dTMP kinase|nr:dTMP kinase [Bacteroidales bacterium]